MYSIYMLLVMDIVNIVWFLMLLNSQLFPIYLTEDWNRDHRELYTLAWPTAFG